MTVFFAFFGPVVDGGPKVSHYGGLMRASKAVAGRSVRGTGREEGYFAREGFEAEGAGAESCLAR